MSKQKVKITFVVDERIHRAFKTACVVKGISQRKALRMLMGKFFEMDGVITYNVDKAHQHIVKYLTIANKTKEAEDGNNQQEEVID